MSTWVGRDHKERVAIVAGVRTPFAKAGTKLKESSAVHLGVAVVREAIARAGIPVDTIDEVVMGNAGTPSDAANISRVIALRAGLPESISAYTVHRNCASALEAIAQGALKIGAGIAETMVVGGTESMSQFPLLFGEDMAEFFASLSAAKSPSTKLKLMTQFRPQWLKPRIAIMEGLTDPISGLNMGQTAEVLARDFKLSRTEQDTFAVKSHERASRARKDGKFSEEIIPVILEPSYREASSEDVGPRDNQSLEQLAKLRPFFDRENGTITPGNACPITDGAVALVMMNEAKAKSLGLPVMGVVTGFAFTGCDPKRMGMGPVYSSALLLDQMKLPLSEIDLVELNEAFAAQVLANREAFASKTYCTEKLGKTAPVGELSDEKLNVNGGAIALGHPVGATGARLVLTSLLEMKRRNARRALATLCIGGGQGGAMVLER